MRWSRKHETEQEIQDIPRNTIYIHLEMQARPENTRYTGKHKIHREIRYTKKQKTGQDREGRAENK